MVARREGIVGVIRPRTGAEYDLTPLLEYALDMLSDAFKLGNSKALGGDTEVADYFGDAHYRLKISLTAFGAVEVQNLIRRAPKLSAEDVLSEGGYLVSVHRECHCRTARPAVVAHDEARKLVTVALSPVLKPHGGGPFPHLRANDGARVIYVFAAAYCIKLTPYLFYFIIPQNIKNQGAFMRG